MVYLLMVPIAISQKCAEHNISFPTPLPLFRGAPEQHYLDMWINSQYTPMARKIAARMADSLTYIPFEKFLEQLKITINDFHAKLGNEPYILVIGEAEQRKRAAGCSDLWMIGLAFEYCGLTEPLKILTQKQFIDELLKNQSATHALVLDDAAYSGSQKSKFLMVFDEVKQPCFAKCTLYWGLPFLSQVAHKKLTDTPSPFKDRIILSHSRLQSLCEVLTEKEIMYVEQAGIDNLDLGQTLTFFDHRFADSFSCMQQIYEGGPLLTRHVTFMMSFSGLTFSPKISSKNHNIKCVNDFTEYSQLTDLHLGHALLGNHEGYIIPTIIPPYRLHRGDQQRALLQAIKLAQVGARTPFPSQFLPEESLVINPSSRQEQSFPAIQWYIDKQEAYDLAIMAGNYQLITYWEIITRQLNMHNLKEELPTYIATKQKNTAPEPINVRSKL